MNVTQSIGRSNIVVPPAEPVLLVDRLVDAPRALVFRAYADPVHLAHFWGPHGSTTTVHELDFRPGGAWRLVIHLPGGGEIVMNSIYLDIDEPERIVFRDAPEDGDPDAPANRISTIRLAEEAGGTRIMAQVQFTSLAERDQEVEMGFARPVVQSMERLEAYLRDR